MAQKLPTWALAPEKGAIPTERGWVSAKTNELLVSHRGLLSRLQTHIHVMDMAMPGGVPDAAGDGLQYGTSSTDFGKPAKSAPTTTDEDAARDLQEARVFYEHVTGTKADGRKSAARLLEEANATLKEKEMTAVETYRQNNGLSTEPEDGPATGANRNASNESEGSLSDSESFNESLWAGLNSRWNEPGK